MVKSSAVSMLALLWLLATPVQAATSSSSLQQEADQIYRAELDDSGAIALTHAILQQRDMQLVLDSGTLTLFKTIRLNSVNLRYGGLFTGRGRLQFRPPLAMERQQLHRFLKSDSLDRSFDRLLLLFDTVTCNQLLKSPGSHPTRPPSKAAQIDTTLNKHLKDAKDRYWYYCTLTNLTQPATDPFLIAVGPVENSGVLLYMSDPSDREQIGLFKQERQVIYEYMFQTVCSYALEADSATGNYNGIDRSPIKVEHYDIDARIRKSGKLDATVRLSAQVQNSVRVLDFYLDPEMKVDSIVTRDGRPVTFARYKDSDKYYGLWLLLDRALKSGDTLGLTFYYSGDIAEMELGQYYVFAGSTWYPRYGTEQLQATFRFSLKSPANYDLIATAKLVDSSTRRDTLSSTWEITEPTRNVSFNIGLFKRYDFDGPGLKPVRVFFSEDLHRWFSSVQDIDVRSTSRHMERQVAEDIQQSMKQYERWFGPCPYDTISVSEILQFASEAFPGFVHLSFTSWITTDEWGYNRLLRAHEAAHQWWGVDVSAETYRDKWLSEGFAQYSAFLYLQQVAGTDRFLDRLDENLKLILSERKNAGAVGLGTRAGNVKDKGNFMLVIYQKGAYVLHMLRYLLMDWQSMSDQRFFDLLKDFHTTYHARYASTYDCAQLVNKYAGADMTWFFDEWVYNKYIPTYNCHYSLKSNPAGGVTARLRIEQKDVPETFRMYLPIELEYPDGHKEYQRVLVDKPAVDTALTLAQAPKKIRFNPFHAVLAKISQ